MTSYKVQFTETALKNLQQYPQTDQKRILQKIERLAANPYHTPNVKRLVNFEPAYRLRVGNYRVLYDLLDDLLIIDVIDILPRKKAYKRR